MPIARFLHHIDHPTPQTPIVFPCAPLQGWVAHSGESAVVGASLATTRGTQALALMERPDVAATFPDLASTGFRGSFDPRLFDTPPTIEFHFDDGETVARPLEFDIRPESIAGFEATKAAKLARIARILRCPLCGAGIDGPPGEGEAGVCASCGASFPRLQYAFDFLNDTLRERGNIFHVDAVSSNDYDGDALGLIERYRDGLVLDDGSGLRSVYYPNVVNFDVEPYHTTDVVGISESLPFRDDAFDAVISVAVLEHVRDPFAAAREIERVLKPGGHAYIAVPFLQPFHGYPDHYYNMTSSGLRNLFPGLVPTSLHVPASGLPVWALSWMLSLWANDLAPEDRETFVNLKVADLMRDPISMIEEPFVKHLSATANERLACVNVLQAVKPFEGLVSHGVEPAH